MSDFNFYAGGPLPPNSPSYITRKADEQASFHLSRMDYISIIEPRQQGKTSLIYQLMNAFKPSGYVFVICDITSMKLSNNSATEWYNSLGIWMLRQLVSIIPDKQQLVLPDSSTSWGDFLFALAGRAKTEGQRVVIVLDEVSRIPSSLATDFFAAIRSIFTFRHSFSSLEYLTFIIAGAFNPKELILDPAISSFNIDQRIHLEDFNLSQIRHLVAHLNLFEAAAEVLANRVFYWTNGQPYLSQELCRTFAAQGELLYTSDFDSLVDDEVTKFLSHDSHYMDRFQRLKEDSELLKYAQSIADGDRPRLIAGVDNRHFRLAHVLGVIKADSDGLCQIRNRICLQALAEMSVIQSLNIPITVNLPAITQPLEEVPYDVFISYSQEDKEAVRNILLSRLESEGLRYYIDEQNFDVGAPILRNITKAINQCRKILLVLTPSSVESEWVMFESLLAQANDPTNRNLRLIPVILKPCTVPTELQHFTYLDLTKPGEFESRMQRLVSSIKL